MSFRNNNEITCCHTCICTLTNRIRFARIGTRWSTVLWLDDIPSTVALQPMSGFDWQTALEFLLMVATAYVLALPIGWDQDKERQPAGIRVFPIVACGACAFVLLAGKLPGGDVQTQARVMVGVISAVGFLSGGAILKDSTGTAARGTAAAASIWVTGAIGVCVAVQQFALALILSVTVYLSHKLLRPASDAARNDKQSPEENKDTKADKPSKNGDKEQGGNKNQGDGEEQGGSQSTGQDQPQEPALQIPNDAPPGSSPASIMGVLVAYKDITVQGLAHRVGLIRDEKEAEYLVDLGPADRLNNLALARGMYMMVHGWITLIGNRQGLRATQVRYNGGVIDIAS